MDVARSTRGTRDAPDGFGQHTSRAEAVHRPLHLEWGIPVQPSSA